MPDPTVKQFQGCLIGCALGDAVGAPVEAQGPLSIETYIENNMRPKLFVGVKRNQGGHDFGQYTDDTQLTRELALSLIQHGKLDPQDFGERVAHLFKNKLMVGYGNATLQAAKNLMAKANWAKAGTPAPAAGNGSAMRAAPIGLAFHDSSLTVLAQAAKMQGFVTHQADIASAGAAAIASAVALAMQVDEVDPPKFLHTVGACTSKIDEEFGEHVLALGKRMNQGDDKILTWCREFQSADPRWQGISPYVVSSVLWALYSFVKTPDDYWETLITSIAPGGDVDTTAAMAGAISGAHLGIAGIPHDVAQLVNDRGEQGYDYLCNLGTKLYGIFA